MAHKHPVYDLDPHFTIDAVTRAITNGSGKTILMQYDHNSERFSFEVNRLVEGHDITLCNKVEIHYTNADSNRQGITYGVYEVDDMVVDSENNDRVVFTWLVSQNATMYSGSLNFLIVFSCVEDDVVVYRWNTNINNSVSVAKGMNNGDIIVTEHADILEQWRNDLFAAATGTNAIEIGPVEPRQYPYIWLDTSENKDTTEKNIGYLTIKAADGVRQRMFPVVKASGVDGLEDALKSIDDDLSSLFEILHMDIESLDIEIDHRQQADDEMSIRIDGLEKLLTGSVNAIAHSLTGKGVNVPNNMSIADVAALIDGIMMDVPTSLRGITITVPPNQTKYYVDEVFNNTGMVVTADFGDGVTIPVANYTVTPAAMAEDTKEITVSLTVNGVTKTTTYPVEVVASMAENVLELGDTVFITETDTTTAKYHVVDKDYYGNILLVRTECLNDPVRYFNSAVGTEAATKYDGSTLDKYLNETFYNSLSMFTADIIKSVDIPVRSNASNGGTKAFLNRKIFTLSATEWGLTSSALEGEAVEYTDKRDIDIAYWTRESPYTSGANFAYYISTSGSRAIGSCNQGGIYVRPAFCVSKDLLLEEVNGGFSVVGSPLQDAIAMMTVDEYGNATITGVKFSVDADGNATITL